MVLALGVCIAENACIRRNESPLQKFVSSKQRVMYSFPEDEIIFFRSDLTPYSSIPYIVIIIIISENGFVYSCDVVTFVFVGPLYKVHSVYMVNLCNLPPEISNHGRRSVW